VTAIAERERCRDRRRRYFIGDRLFALPGVPVAEEGESIQSLIWRASETNGTSQKATAATLTMPTRIRPTKSVPLRNSYLVLPWHAYKPEQSEALTSTFLASLATKCFRYHHWDSPQTVGLREAIRVSSTLVCPTCLSESPAHHRLAWRVGAVFMCERHGCLLSEACDECGLEHGTPRHDRGMVPIHGKHVGSTVKCMNPAPVGSERARAKQPCGHDLRTIETLTVTDPGLASAQTEILKALNSDGPFQVRPDEWMTALEFFDDLYLLCGLALFAAPESSADGLGSELEAAWRRHCSTRARNLAERDGQKGSLDRGMADIPSPAIMAVAVRKALPIVAAPNEEERRERLADLLEHVRGRQRRALDRARRAERLSPGLKLALVELTIRENRILSYLSNHPRKGRYLDLRHYDAEITPELILREFPAFAKHLKADELVLPVQVMLRFFLSLTAAKWGDVFHVEDPPAVASKVLRLVNVAGLTGQSRALARWIATLGARDDEYRITMVRTFTEDGNSYNWQERMPEHLKQGCGIESYVRHEVRSLGKPIRGKLVSWKPALRNHGVSGKPWENDYPGI